MKANELQTGDWVHYWILEIDAKINDIMSTGRLGIIFTDSKGEVGYIHGIMSESIKPIPLTEEILAKNFEVTDDVVYGKYYTYYTDYMEVEIGEHFDDGIWRIRIYDNGHGRFPKWVMYVENVHQLQHAMRLARIEMEIEL